ncbi:transcriptional regulator [Parvibaculum sp.]|uniref:helix-turn-helix domain-containing protein n=1 Tax=Parvibaculum sp. TaxID=2024848 RepID=UPI001DDC5042|nr:transcriptional regulator [Parvibaculum sp.]MBX3491040.1 transcriptional regulator [Parvibaculum sp.]MCW5728860.1 transcriptional regulator [Parvibaculum sp.]
MSEVGHDIKQGLKEALTFSRGKAVGARVHIPAEIDVKAMRGRLGMTQKEFLETFKIPVGTLRDWEPGCRAPDQPSRMLLRVIDRELQAAKRALKEV